MTKFADADAFGATITAGSDGALWIGTGIGAALQRVTTAGVITTEATVTGQIGTITTGPAESLWMTILNPGEIDSVQLAQPQTQGFRTASTDGGVYRFGTDVSYGSLTSLGVHPSHPVIGISSISGGYRLVGTDGGVFGFGDAHFLGSLPSHHITPAKPIVGIASTPSGNGYWLVGADGGVFAFGDAHYLGSPGSAGVRAPVVGLQATTNGDGYWETETTGVNLNFGASNSLGNATPTATVVGISG